MWNICMRIYMHKSSLKLELLLVWTIFVRIDAHKTISH